MKRLLALGVFVTASLGLPLVASANPLLDHSAGVKLLGGADLYSTPSDRNGYSGIDFAGNAGGFSYGALGYYELRLIKFVGIELGFGYNHGSFHRNVTENGIDVTETVTMSDLRIPILAKFVLPIPLGRLWLGVGPEFSIPLDASAKLEVKSGATIGDDVSYSAKKETSIYGTGGLGLVIEVPVVGIEIPVEFRASKNFSQESAWQDRFSVSNAEIKAQSTWDLRLAAGVGVSF
jgi:hypothetical protein